MTWLMLRASRIVERTQAESAGILQPGLGSSYMHRVL
jgi:hypothetical protein